MKQFNLFYFYLIYFIFCHYNGVVLELIMYLDLQCSENVNTKIVPEKLIIYIV